MKNRTLRQALSIFISTFLLAPTIAFTCTSFIIKSNDNGYVYGRTLEFGIDLQSQPIMIPRHFHYQGTGVEGQPGMAWDTKYAVIGLNGIGLPVFVDGMNEKGMTGGLLYAPNTAKFPDVLPSDSKNSIASYEILTYALTNFSNVDEAKAVFQTLKVNQTGHAPFKGAIPIHMTLHDAQGKSIVIEYNNGKVFIYDNPTGVMTNDPIFPYHLANIGLYVNLSPKEAKPLMINGAVFGPPSSGSGLHGIPGDFLSPSRFIRALMFASSASTQLSAAEQVSVAFHILDNFDIPPGAVQLSSQNPYGGGANSFETTEWSSVADAKNLVYYVRTYQNNNLQMLDMKKLDLNAKQIKTFKLRNNEVRVDVTS